MIRCLVFYCLLFVSGALMAQSDSTYLFCYFIGNGNDGLHYAASKDGMHFEALKNGESFLEPRVSKDKLMRDPCILRGADGLFHMVWTVSWNDRGIGYASSSDLIHWSEQQFVPVMMQEDSARNCWAPEINYDPLHHRYMIYWATTIKGKFPADPTVENGYNHRIYCTLTKDFKKYSKTKLLYDHGFNVIDASIVANGNQYLMFLKDETPKPIPQKNLHVAISKKLNGGYSTPSASITGKYWAEGPTAIKIGDQWVVYFDKYRDHRYGAVASKDLINWTDISDQLSMPKGLRHGTVIRISAAELESLKKQ